MDGKSAEVPVTDEVCYCKKGGTVDIFVGAHGLYCAIAESEWNLETAKHQQQQTIILNNVTDAVGSSIYS